MAPEVKPAKNSKLPKLPENYFEPVNIWVATYITGSTIYLLLNCYSYSLFSMQL
jgi:hypothetical protein